MASAPNTTPMMAPIGKDMGDFRGGAVFDDDGGKDFVEDGSELLTLDDGAVTPLLLVVGMVAPVVTDGGREVLGVVPLLGGVDTLVVL